MNRCYDRCFGVLDRQAAGTLPTRYERRRAVRFAGRLARESQDEQSLHAGRAATAALRCAEDEASRNDWARDALVEAIKLAQIRGGDARQQLLTELHLKPSSEHRRPAAAVVRSPLDSSTTHLPGRARRVGYAVALGGRETKSSNRVCRVSTRTGGTRRNGVGRSDMWRDTPGITWGTERSRVRISAPRSSRGRFRRGLAPHSVSRAGEGAAAVVAWSLGACRLQAGSLRLGPGGPAGRAGGRVRLDASGLRRFALRMTRRLVPCVPARRQVLPRRCHQRTQEPLTTPIP